ncbi:unnamed protein product [Toxocara canis]|uniref:Transmembrane protein n=1 Tax=Toxocara canis TaxID=6265 RepID=A0A183URP5_TOXCA|nr:unnamed protein product [Toxocara canis]
MEAGPSTFPSTSITLPNDDDAHTWYNRRVSSLSTLDDQRISPTNYEEIKKLIVLAGVFFMVAVFFFLMKLEVTGITTFPESIDVVPMFGTSATRFALLRWKRGDMGEF